MDDKENPCQQQNAKRAPRHWNRLDFPSKRQGKIGKTISKFWNRTDLSSKAERVRFLACGVSRSDEMGATFRRWRWPGTADFPVLNEIWRMVGVDRRKLEPGRRSTGHLFGRMPCFRWRYSVRHSGGPAGVPWSPWWTACRRRGVPWSPWWPARTLSGSRRTCRPCDKGATCRGPYMVQTV